MKDKATIERVKSFYEWYFKKKETPIRKKKQINRISKNVPYD